MSNNSPSSRQETSAQVGREMSAMAVHTRLLVIPKVTGNHKVSVRAKDLDVAMLDMIRTAEGVNDNLDTMDSEAGVVRPHQPNSHEFYLRG